MAHAIVAQRAVFDDDLVERTYADFQVIRERRLARIGAFFSHRHHYDGAIDHVTRADGMGFLRKGGLVYCIPLKDLQWFSYGHIQGYILYDDFILPAVISLDHSGHDDDDDFKASESLGKFLEGTLSTIAVRHQPLPFGVVETEKVFRVGGLTASKIYRVRARTTIDLSQPGIKSLPVLYYPDIVCGHAHANDQYTEKTYHSHWRDDIKN